MTFENARVYRPTVYRRIIQRRAPPRAEPPIEERPPPTGPPAGNAVPPPPRTEPPTPKLEPPKYPLLRELWSLLLKTSVIAIIAVLIFTFIYGLHRNADPAMSPAVKDGDLLMFYRLDRDYAAGDVLMLTFRGERQARRVVAVSGDTVDIAEAGLIVNGALQQEPGIYEATQRYVDGIEYPITLAVGEVFVLGDARENATDSRVYGAVNEKDTLGTVIAVIRRRSL